MKFNKHFSKNGPNKLETYLFKNLPTRLNKLLILPIRVFNKN